MVLPAWALPADGPSRAALPEQLALDPDRAFEHVVIAYRDDVVSFAARLLGDRSAAEDVAQDTFVRAYRALAAYPPERRRALHLRSWLIAIAHNLSRNAVRDAGPRRDSLDDRDAAAGRRAADPHPGPEGVALDGERWEAIERAVARLSPRLRPAFLLRYVEELSYDEIAGVLAQPVGTVKASAHRGLLAVRALLEADHAG